MNQQSILVVDDHPLNIKLVRCLLERSGYPVRVAADGIEMRAVLQDFHPDLILMDIQLPGQDGLELTRELKADPRFRDIRIVALTSYAMAGDAEKAIAAGCDGYLPKPIDTRAFPAQIQAYLEHVC